MRIASFPPVIDLEVRRNCNNIKLIIARTVAKHSIAQDLLFLFMIMAMEDIVPNSIQFKAKHSYHSKQ